jgi:hypothetical protein
MHILSRYVRCIDDFSTPGSVKPSSQISAMTPNFFAPYRASFIFRLESPMKCNFNLLRTSCSILLAAALATGSMIGLSATAYAESAAHKTPKQPCAGPSAIQCPGGMKCIDDPADKCDPTKEGINCPGICVAGAPISKVKQPCGGPTGIVCQGGMICVDDPSDDCDPTKEGVNCKGMCMSK